MPNEYGEAAFLGALQGVTEFLPISSDGHLALAERLFGLSQGGLTLNVMLHVGTLAATLVIMRAPIGEAVAAALHAVRSPSTMLATPGGRDAWVVVLASIPTAVIGLSMRDAVERFTESGTAIGAGFLGTGCVLLASRWAPRRDLAQPSLGGAVLFGIAQGLAVLPGLSRSASTITTALFLGLRRERAFELSMLISLPAVAGATLLEGRHALATPEMLGPAAFGAAVAFGVGLGALSLLRRIVVQDRFAWFALWVFPLAAVAFVS